MQKRKYKSSPPWRLTTIEGRQSRVPAGCAFGVRGGSTGKEARRIGLKIATGFDRRVPSGTGHGSLGSRAAGTASCSKRINKCIICRCRGGCARVRSSPRYLEGLSLPHFDKKRSDTLNHRLVCCKSLDTVNDVELRTN